ncbi:hypothetical protein I4F81_012216 [Pyropia yezoensis]|uniref:Uncharacterized protein n=1 Tax=Pyropia yezoensis TaxID=2788 RepID=A0ACC3CIH8_PYRYE|nr:hypothetical protein I4F81_012216 [Neopyropia yezoensis]
MEDVTPPSPAAWATDPLGTIHARIRTAVQAATGGASRPILDLDALTKDLPPTASLPLLTPTTPAGTLARLTGMVQDVADPDLWYTRYGPAPGRTTWGVEEVDADTNALLQAESESGGGGLAQRVGARLVTPPGLTPWARHAGGGGVLMSAAAPAAAPPDGAPEGGEARGGKRKLDDAAAADAMDAEAPPAAAVGGPEKRPRDGAGAGQTAGSSGGTAATAAADALLFPGEELDDEEAAATLGLNLPVAADAATGGTSVLVKVYGADEPPASLQLHKLVTVVGVVVAGAAGGPPVVHALRVDGADVSDIHPALPPAVSAADAVTTTAAATAGRGEVVAHLAVALGGDTLAATYLAACLASRVCVRTETAVLGKLSVNLVLPRAGGGGAGTDVSYIGIAGAVAAVVPRMVRLVADIPHLNAAPWYAVKDDSVNRLRAGPLQAAPGGVLAVDATGLSAGTLNATGVCNVKALSQVAVSAVAPVKFFGLDSQIPADAPLLVVSRGGKAIIPTDAVVHVRPTRGGDGAAAVPPPVDLAAARRALALATVASGDLVISENMRDEVSRTFVEARAAAAAAARSRASGGSSGGGGGAAAAAAAAPVDADTLGRWLGLARSLARFRGESTLTTELWGEAVRFDRECLRRSMPETLRGRGTPAHAVSQPLRQARAGSG